MTPEYLDVPIFPLPNVTFFPRTVMPLHIFEPRYREMIADCLRGDRMLGVALLRDGWQKDYFGHPPIHRTFGIGKIIDHDRLEDGRYNLHVEGLYRARLITEYPTQPYRTGRALVLQERPIDGIRNRVGATRKELFEACEELGSMMPEYAPPIQGAWASHPHPSVVVDQLAAMLVLDAYDRQSILEEIDPLRRMQLMLVQINQILRELSFRKVTDPRFEEDVFGDD
jgi:uncharacterized protein